MFALWLKCGNAEVYAGHFHFMTSMSGVCMQIMLHLCNILRSSELWRQCYRVDKWSQNVSQLEMYTALDSLSDCTCVCVFLCLLTCSYVDKLTEFLRLFVNIHLPRFERSEQFPVIDFLGVLFRFTFQQVGYCHTVDLSLTYLLTYQVS